MTRRSRQTEGPKLAEVEYTEILRDEDTDRAILFRIDGRDVWLPRSEIEVDRDARIVVVPEWWAIDKEIV